MPALNCINISRACNPISISFYHYTTEDCCTLINNNNNNNKISLLKGGARYLWYQLGTTINKKEKKVQSDLKGKS